MFKKKFAIFMTSVLFSIPLLNVSANAQMLTVPYNSGDSETTYNNNTREVRETTTVYQNNNSRGQYNQRYNNRNNRSSKQVIVRKEITVYEQPSYNRGYHSDNGYRRDDHRSYNRRSNGGLVIQINPFPTIRFETNKRHRH